MEGNRFYSNPSFVLKSFQIRKLKKMNKVYTFDQMFIAYLLVAVFGEEVLKNVSSDGKSPHLVLDAAKLKFIESKNIRKKRYTEIVLMLLFYHLLQMYLPNE